MDNSDDIVPTCWAKRYATARHWQSSTTRGRRYCRWSVCPGCSSPQVYRLRQPSLGSHRARSDLCSVSARRHSWIRFETESRCESFVGFSIFTRHSTTTSRQLETIMLQFYHVHNGQTIRQICFKIIMEQSRRNVVWKLIVSTSIMGVLSFSRY